MYHPYRNLIDVDGSPTTKHSQSSMDSSAAVGKPPASLPTPSSSSSQYRGLRVELPFDFLRVRTSIDRYALCVIVVIYYILNIYIYTHTLILKPPGWVGSEQTIADEDLARMLQVIDVIHSGTYIMSTNTDYEFSPIVLLLFLLLHMS